MKVGFPGSRPQKRNSHRFRLGGGLWLVCGLFLAIANSVDHSAFSQNPSLLSQRRVKPVCTDKNLETLTTQLLQDLPNYTNRATQRARRRSRSSDLYSYMLVAGKPEFKPLPLNPGSQSANSTDTSTSGVEQVFFSTLERQYIGGKAIELQQFHWALLTKTTKGWRLVMMFSQSSLDSAKQLQSPPRDTSKSAIAEGINTWLRDCQNNS